MTAICRPKPLTFDAVVLPLDDPRRLWFLRAIGLLLALGIARLAIVAVLPLSDGEAYYDMWARFPAWSYYDHPPMIAWLSWLTTRASHSPFAVRLGPVLCAEVSGGLIYALACPPLLAACRLHRLGCGLGDSGVLGH